MTKFLIFLLAIPLALYSFSVKGTINRSDTRDVLPGATVVILSNTNITAIGQTDNRGRFILEAPKGRYSLVVSMGGYYKETRSIDVNSDLNYSLYLVPQSAISLGEIDVVGDKLKDTASKNNMSKAQRDKATTSITGDPLNSLTKMPGVNTGNSFGQNTRLSVRGGTGNENEALLDDALIHYPYHHLLPDSVFIDDIIGTISLYKGVIPASYGQAMSSLLEVNSDDGKPGFHGKLNVGLLNSYLTLSGASEDQKWNFVGGIRRTYYDLILPLFVQNVGFSTNFTFPYYLDSHGRIKYSDGSDTVSFVWLYSTEPMDISNLVLPNMKDITNSFRLDYWNATINLDWKHSFDREWYFEQTLGMAYDSQLQLIQNPDVNFYTEANEWNVRSRTLVGYRPSETLSFELGGEVIYYPHEEFTNFNSLYSTNLMTGIPGWMTLMSNSFNGKMGIYSVFIENNIDLFDKIIYLQDGLRLNYVDIVNNYSLDPRITLGWRINSKNKIYAAVGYLSEFPDDAGTLQGLDLNTNLNIPGCWHYVLGSELNVLGSYALSMEGYLKNYNNCLNKESNSVLMDTANKQRMIYGVDILLTKSVDFLPVYGWFSLNGFVAQSYLVTGSVPVQTDPQPPVGQWYDDGSILYQLDLTVVWDIAKFISLTGEFQWQSGAAYTPLKTTQTVIAGPSTNILPVWGDYHSARLPDQHSLNVKIDFFWTLFELPMGAFVQVNDLYNYRPVNGITYNSDYSQKTERISPIGIYPSVGIWLKW